MKPTIARACDDDSDNLNCYIHDGAAHLRFEFEGSLSGEAARQLEQSWCTASSVIGNRSLVIALGNVSSIDPAGRALLRRWHEAGAQFVVKSPLVATLVGSIIGRQVRCSVRNRRSDNWAPAASKAWQEYVESVNTRMEERLSSGKAFLWADESPDRLARVRAGEVIVAPVGPEDPMRVPSGRIHDWVGTAFIRDVGIANVLAIARESCDVQIDDRRAYSVSTTTRIEEIRDGAGIGWRQFSIARFAERDGGVYIELESIGLSRNIPAMFRWLVQPIVRRISPGALPASLRHALNVLHTAEVFCGNTLLAPENAAIRHSIVFH